MSGEFYNMDCMEGMARYPDKYPDTTTNLSVEFFEDTNGIMQICYKDFDMHSLHVLDLIMCRKNHIAIKQRFNGLREPGPDDRKIHKWSNKAPSGGGRLP